MTVTFVRLFLTRFNFQEPSNTTFKTGLVRAIKELQQDGRLLVSLVACDHCVGFLFSFFGRIFVCVALSMLSDTTGCAFVR